VRKKMRRGEVMKKRDKAGNEHRNPNLRAGREGRAKQDEK